MSNKRYSNEGARIDFITMDSGLFERVDQTKLHEPQGAAPHKNIPSESGRAALLATTAFGGWEPAPFDGGGIVDAQDRVFDVHLSLPPTTGIIYTPPKWSDHVAVSCYLQPGPDDTPLILQSDAETKHTQPHSSFRSIKSFFGGKKSSSTNAPLKKSKEKIEIINTTHSFNKIANKSRTKGTENQKNKW